MRSSCECPTCLGQTDYSWELTVDGKTWYLVEQRMFEEPRVLVVVRDDATAWAPSLPSQSTWAVHDDP